jgi:glycine cleavage system H protein
VLEDSPELVNSDAYGEGWIVKVIIDELNQVNELLSLENYKKLLG